MTEDTHTLRTERISATVAANGAELCSLQNADGLELLWQAGPAWRRHAPVLFPIVGRLKDDQLKHRGQVYPMTQHGFARDRRFAWVERGPTSCTLVLSDDVDTRTHYPFPFRLTISYTVDKAQLHVAYAIGNTGSDLLPASIGAHPAFNWPLSPELRKEDYRLTFSDAEPAPIRRLSEGLLRAAPEPTPIAGNTLALAEPLFDADAVIMDHVASSSVRYAANRGPAITVAWDNFRELGIWSKPGGADFLCIEPWHGTASPADFDGDVSDKPGVMLIAPGAQRILRYQIQVE